MKHRWDGRHEKPMVMKIASHRTNRDRNRDTATTGTQHRDELLWQHTCSCAQQCISSGRKIRNKMTREDVNENSSDNSGEAPRADAAQSPEDEEIVEKM